MVTSRPRRVKVDTLAIGPARYMNVSIEWMPSEVIDPRGLSSGFHRHASFGILNPLGTWWSDCRVCRSPRRPDSANRFISRAAAVLRR